MRNWLFALLMLMLAGCGPAATEVILPTSDDLPTATETRTPFPTEIPTDLPTATVTDLPPLATPTARGVPEIDLTTFDNVYQLPNGLTITYPSDMTLVPIVGESGIMGVTLNSPDGTLDFARLGVSGEEEDYEILSDFESAEMITLENGEAIRVFEQMQPLTSFDYAVRHPEFGILLASGTIDETVRDVSLEQLDAIVGALGDPTVAGNADLVFEAETFEISLDNGTTIGSEAAVASAAMLPEMDIRLEFRNDEATVSLSFAMGADFAPGTYSAVELIPTGGDVAVFAETGTGDGVGNFYAAAPSGAVEITENTGNTISGTVDVTVGLQADITLEEPDPNAPETLTITGNFENIPITVPIS